MTVATVTVAVVVMTMAVIVAVVVPVVIVMDVDVRGLGAAHVLKNTLRRRFCRHRRRTWLHLWRGEQGDMVSGARAPLPPSRHTMQRRAFLATLGSLTTVGAAAACASHSKNAAATSAMPSRPPVPRIGPVGLQLYTVRTQMEKDMPGTIAQVAAIGYRELEFAGYFGRTPAEVRALLARNGLTSPSTHIPIDLLNAGTASWQKALDDANEIGHQWVTIPWLAPEARPKTADGWRRLAATLSRGAEQAHSSGLRFAYHNHDFEFVTVPGDGGAGVLPYELLLRETDPTRVGFEMDVYWVTKAGQDPISLMARFPGRFHMLHLKDATPKPAQNFTEVGHGTINWPAVLAARGQAGVEHVFVEQDESPDPMASIRTSYEYLASLK